MFQTTLTWTVELYADGARVIGFCTSVRDSLRTFETFLEEVNKIEAINLISREHVPNGGFVMVSSEVIRLRWDVDSDTSQLRADILAAVGVASADNDAKFTIRSFETNHPGHQWTGQFTNWSDALPEQIFPSGGELSDFLSRFIRDESRLNSNKERDYTHNRYSLNENLNNLADHDPIPFGEEYEVYPRKTSGQPQGDLDSAMYLFGFRPLPVTPSEFADALHEERAQDRLSAALSDALAEGEVGGEGSIGELVEGLHGLLFGAPFTLTALVLDDSADADPTPDPTES